jgi:hypothetical protein
VAKYLVLMAPGPALPAPTQVSQAAESAKSWVAEQKQNGRLDVAYTYPQGGGCAIFNVGSSEELQELLARNPGHAYVQYTVYPLVEFDEGIDRLSQGREYAEQ